MTKYLKMASMASALAVAMSAGTVSAQSTGDSAGSGAQGGGTTANSMTFQQWLNTQGGKGRITRQAYMDEASRRWDAMDKEKRGLTRDEINSLYYSGGMGGPTANKPNEKKGINQ